MAALFTGWGADPFSELVDKATSELLPAGQEDIALNLEVCDQVRAKQVPPKQAMQVIKRRLGNKNPNVVLLALGVSGDFVNQSLLLLIPTDWQLNSHVQLTDICIKNGGDHFLAEVASREFMDNLASILRNPSGVNNDVKAKALALIQNWSQIAEAKPQHMGYISETYKSLCSSGFEFPPMDAKSIVSAALVETMTAPEWTDSEVCMRCRTAFTTFNRKHHCRNCGNVFDQECSSKVMALPWFGVGQDVRVCDGCFVKKSPPNKTFNNLSRSKSAAQIPTGRGGAGSHHRSRTMDTGAKKKSQSIKEEDDLALAIKLSLEASTSSGSRPGFVTSQPPVKEGRPTKQADGRMLEGTDADDDPDLAAAIAASLRDYAAPAPSAPDDLDDGRAATPRPGQYASQIESHLPLPPSLELPASDIDALLSFSHSATAQEAFARQHGQWPPPHQQLQTQELYERAAAARPHMARSLDEATRRRGVLVSMHDKLSEAVRLYDRLLDAQMSRPIQYGVPYHNAAPYPPPNVGYLEAQPGIYPSMPLQSGHQYSEPEQQHHLQYSSPSNLQYGAGIESPYMGHQNSHMYGPPPTSSASHQGLASPNMHNRWETLPSAPLNTITQSGSEWTNLSPPSQNPAQGSLYSTIPSLPHFEALPAHEQRQAINVSSTTGSGTAPSLDHDAGLAEDKHGWRDIPIKQSTLRVGEDNSSIMDSSRNISSTYSAQPWTRPVETPLIDL